MRRPDAEALTGARMDCLLIETEGVEETERLGDLMARVLLEKSAFARGCVILLTGPLGAGKTAFVRGLARGLNVPTMPKSPTFALHHSHAGTRRLEHFDLYRLRESGTLDELGLDELFAGEGVVAVEWAERLGDRVPPDAVTVTIEPLTGDRRRLKIAAPADRRDLLNHLPGMMDASRTRN